MLYFFFQFEFISAFQSQPRRALTLLSDPLTISALSETRVAIGQRAVLLRRVHVEQ